MKKILILIVLVSSATIAQRSRTKKNTTTSKTTTTTSNSAKDNDTNEEGMGFNKGDFSISGQFGVTSKSTKLTDAFGNQISTSTTTIGIAPSAQYFLTNAISLGGTIGFRNESNSSSSNSANTFLFGAFARYYFSAPKQFSLFGQGGIGIESQGDLTTFTVGVKPGLSYFLSNHFAVEATVGEVGVRATDGNTDFNFGLDLNSIGIGVLYKF